MTLTLSIQYEHSTKQKHIEISLQNLEAHIFLFKCKSFGAIRLPQSTPK